MTRTTRIAGRRGGVMGAPCRASRVLGGGFAVAEYLRVKLRSVGWGGSWSLELSAVRGGFFPIRVIRVIRSQRKRTMNPVIHIRSRASGRCLGKTRRFQTSPLIIAARWPKRASIKCDTMKSIPPASREWPLRHGHGQSRLVLAWPWRKGLNKGNELREAL